MPLIYRNERAVDNAATGAAYKAKRESLGLSPQDLATRLGKTRVHVVHHEAGLRSWSEQDAIIFDKALSQ